MYYNGVQILYDGTDHAVVAALRRITCVTLFFVRHPFASPAEIRDFEAQNAIHVQWGRCAALRAHCRTAVCTLHSIVYTISITE